MRTPEERQAAVGKAFVKLVLVVGLCFGLGVWALSAYQERQQRRGRPDLQPKKLHACQAPPEKVASEWRAGRVIMDAKCDDFGGIYILSAPRR